MTPRPNRATRGYLARELGAQLAAARPRGRDTLAADAGIAKNGIRDVELGIANPTLKRVEALADIYGVDITITVHPRGGRS